MAEEMIAAPKFKVGEKFWGITTHWEHLSVDVGFCDECGAPKKASYRNHTNEVYGPLVVCEISVHGGNKYLYNKSMAISTNGRGTFEERDMFLSEEHALHEKAARAALADISYANFKLHTGITEDVKGD